MKFVKGKFPIVTEEDGIENRYGYFFVDEQTGTRRYGCFKGCDNMWSLTELKSGTNLCWRKTRKELVSYLKKYQSFIDSYLHGEVYQICCDMIKEYSNGQ